MKILTQFIENVAGIEIYPLISFIIFFVFFLGVSYYVFRLDKNFVDEVAAYPIQADDSENSESNDQQQAASN